MSRGAQAVGCPQRQLSLALLSGLEGCRGLSGWTLSRTLQTRLACDRKVQRQTLDESSFYCSRGRHIRLKHAEFPSELQERFSFRLFPGSGCFIDKQFAYGTLVELHMGAWAEARRKGIMDRGKSEKK